MTRLTKLSTHLSVLAAAFICIGFLKAVSLKLVNVEIVNLKDQPGTIWEAVNQKPPSREIIKITFAADADLMELARGSRGSGGLNIFRSTSICNGNALDKDRDLGGGSEVYADGVKVDENSESSLSSERRHGAQRLYYVFIPVKLAEASPRYI